MTDVEVARDAGVTLTYEDGHVASFGLEELRVNCPCAECRGVRDRGGTPWPTPSAPRPLRIDDAELVGGWGLALRWNDGHGTGIFTWDALRAWSDARG